ncbi:beta-hexosaminidase 3 [Artemisia annua]|uniref:Beta-hexosaminidase 3 n=1 Tax=Artemisia annua TaxID=35608 RepID=A0A2U1MDD5_ARTAN|nr:beta-hexosaminidase 3 [Artemisia annua]
MKFDNVVSFRGVGYPALWPSKNCGNLTFKLIDGVLSDFSKIFKYRCVHLRCDEVDTSISHIQK